MKPRLISRLQALLPRLSARPEAAPALPWKVRLSWASRRWLELAGWPGMLAAGVLAMNVALYFSAILPAQAQLEAAHQSVISLHRQQESSSKTPGNKVLTPAEQLARFYRIFPHESRSPEWLEKLVAVAESRGIRLNEGEYKASYDKAGKLVRYQITLPLKGEYPQIRRFLAALPTELPVVALENVQFERQKVADPNVEARIRLVLFLGRES
ncbi:MAG: hypothetical protein ABIG70_01620 [Pseudomonadota bacterium]